MHRGVENFFSTFENNAAQIVHKFFSMMLSNVEGRYEVSQLMSGVSKIELYSKLLKINNTILELPLI